MFFLNAKLQYFRYIDVVLFNICFRMNLKLKNQEAYALEMSHGKS